MLSNTRITVIPIYSLGRNDFQLGPTVAEDTAAMSIFQPALTSINRIATAIVALNNICHKTAAVDTHETMDTFCLCIRGPPLMTNVLLILESPSVGLSSLITFR